MCSRPTSLLRFWTSLLRNTRRYERELKRLTTELVAEKEDAETEIRALEKQLESCLAVGAAAAGEQGHAKEVEEQAGGAEQIEKDHQRHIRRRWCEQAIGSGGHSHATRYRPVRFH